MPVNRFRDKISDNKDFEAKKNFSQIKAPCLSCGKLDNVDYFEAGRSARKRSLLPVNEHFERKPDAKRITLGNFSLIRTHRLVRTQ